MNDSRIEFKVGLFVAGGLALVALLILNFSRGTTLFKPTYQLHIIMPTTAGLKQASDVTLFGVPIGKVSDLGIGSDGKSVELTVVLLAKYPIRKDSLFHVDALGFLGDQYIEVSPPASTASNTAGFFRDGDTVYIREVPFNMQEAARSTSGLLDQARETMKNFDQAITNVNRTILSNQTMTNFSEALSNFQSLTAIAVKVAQGAAQLLQSNSPPVTEAVTNLRVFSLKLNLMADELDQVILTNRGDVSATAQNLRDTSASFKQLASDLQAGHGLAGGLLKDQEMKAQVTLLLSNANATTAAFGAFGSNLNQRGLWKMLWTPKPAERTAAPAP